MYGRVRAGRQRDTLDGYWVRTSVKVDLTKEEKVSIRRPSSPRWELDIVGYSGRDNVLRGVEFKKGDPAVQNQEQFLTLLRDALESIREPRFFETERGFQGELLIQMGKRLKYAELPGDPIIEQEYQKTIPRHRLNIRPDIIVHIPFERGRVERRDEGNFVAMELKLRATENEARGDFANLMQMREVLGYLLTVFINIDSAETHAALCPEPIIGQTVCFAVRLEDGKPVVRATGPAVRKDGRQ